MRIFLIIIWGILAFISVTGTLYIITNYEIQRWKDRARRHQGAYIRRVNQAEALLTIFTPGFPCLGFFLHLVEEGSPGFWYELGGILMSIMFMLYAWYVHVAYVKIASEGVEQRIWFSNPTRYPFNAINRVVYYEKPDIDEPDMVGFYAKSGFQIALFDPITHNNYRLLAIVRFRIENERWPDMTNPEDVAKVDILDKRGMTISYFKGLQKVTGLADVYM